MATKRVVSCVALSSNAFSSRVAAVGGVHPDGCRWSLSTEAAIAGIDRAEWTFHVEVAGALVPVIIRATEAGDRHLCVVGSDTEVNHLMLLPECPQATGYT